MKYSEAVLGTPKVLDQCLDALSKPDNKLAPLELLKASTPAKWASHPDIQFFSSVKKKNHYNYHKSKRAMELSHGLEPGLARKKSNFDPFSRDLLLLRLRSYTALNWEIPHSKQNHSLLTELFCSAHGWECDPVSRHNIFKNSLRCTGCNHQLVLRFNSLDQQPDFAPCEFDLDDIQELNSRLKELYLNQIKLTAHAALCPWRNFACPLVGTYYLTPHVTATNEKLISAYLALLHKLYRNLAIADHYAHALLALAPRDAILDLTAFIKVSNLWLLSRYFKDSKENFGPVLEKTLPSWAYVLAAMGWDLHVQVFQTQTVPLLACTMCNLRIFLHSEFLEKTGFREHNDILEATQESLNYERDLYNENVGQGDRHNFGTIEIGDSNHSGLAGHKEWCAVVKDFGETPYFSYFYDMILSLEAHIGPEGQYVNTEDDFKEVSDKDNSRHHETRKRGLDVRESLDRFLKLRKLYFADANP